jgi:NAD(P)-dependent dehydrogenase (short-subunit alcohol dehydrogenase family)
METCPLKSKTALITGAAKRIGREIALSLASEGMNIIVHYNRSRADADDLCRQLKGNGVNAWAIASDFQRSEEYENLFEQALAEAGSIDVLINNASIFPQETLDDLTFGSIVRNLEVNAWVPFYLGRAFARVVGHGSIINLVDSRVASYDWNHVGYLLSKHVMAALTAMMAVRFAPNVAVNAVAPGLILPPPGQDVSYIEQRASTVPLQKHGGPKDVADAVVYLLKTSFVTGETIYVDGGRHLKEYETGQNTH